MSQINLDTSPYFDDFDADKDYYKVLFKPGFPVQARELTTLQSILQNQISKFGEHFFKEGSMVIPGSITYNPNYYAVLLNVQQGGVDISLYLEELVGVTIRGETSGVKAKVVDYLLPPDDGISDPTIFVSYSDSGTDEETSTFLDNEALINLDPVLYGNTTITAGSIFATTISENATTIGSAAKITEGVYFLRGTFVKVDTSTVILEPYVNTPTYRVGLQINEKVVTAGQDESLYDNAKGFNNFSAPGADRLQITTTLTKKPINDFNDTNFVELLRVTGGEIKKLEDRSEYNLFRDYLAERTFDESGNYVVDGLGVSLDECLNDGIGNGGIYTIDQTTDQGSVPSDDLAIAKVAAGKAYVRGYDVKNPGTFNVDIRKPRTTNTISAATIPFEMGSRFIVNNVSGTPVFGLDIEDNIVSLYSGRRSGSSATGELIGEARVYTFGLEDAPYRDSSTPWSLYLYDLQVFNKVDLNVSASSLLAGYRVKGKRSNATAFVRSVSGSTVYLTQVSGEFQRGESLIINGTEKDSISITSIVRYSASDAKSVFQDTSAVDATFTTDFIADIRSYPKILKGFTPSDLFTISSGGNITCPGRTFDDFKIGDIVAYQKPGEELVTYNSVSGVAADRRSATLVAIANVPDLSSGALPSSQIQVTVRIGKSSVLNQEKAFLYSVMDRRNIASVNLNGSSVIFSAQITNETVDSDGFLVVNSSNLGQPGAVFYPFDQERYSIHYSDGSVQSIRSDEVIVESNQVFFYNCRPNETNVTVNVTASKVGVKSKTKIIVRSEELVIDKISTGIGTEEYDLDQNDFYGLRLDDEEVSLNVADVKEVLAVYESLDAAIPILDKLTFLNGLDLEANLVIGEKLIGEASGAVARLVSIPDTASVRIVYLGQEKFQLAEQVTFQESNLTANIQGITEGNFTDLTSSFKLDSGRREQFYDYSRIIRDGNATAPNKKLLVIYDRFDVPANDTGDFYTVNSYDEETFNSGMPMVANGNIRASDTLDFRPRVKKFTSTTASPFAYSSRDFGITGSTPTIITTPNEGISLGYDYYQGRADRLVLDPEGDFKVIEGSPSDNPALPTAADGVIELARIHFPAYLYNIDDAKIVNIDNKRYTMKDIGKLEDRIDFLEELTTLSLLERETEALQLLDSDGNNRFKSGFFADDFESTNAIDYDNRDTRIDIIKKNSLVTLNEFSTLPLSLQLQNSIDDSQLDLSTDLPLLDVNTTKSGDLVTLNYDETEWIKQPLASRSAEVNPFNIVLYKGNVKLSPASDDFIITRNIDNRRVDVYGDADNTQPKFAEGIEVAQYMRERNVGFSANSLRPHTKFYPFFEGASGIDIIPKILEVAMVTGSFLSGEIIEGFNGTTRIFRARLAAPNHKEGNFVAPTRTYTSNPYDRDTTISSSYSASSTIVNIDIESLASMSDGRFYGLLTKSARIIGSSSGAVADIRDLRLVSDSFGELAGAFHFRDPYSTPAPSFRLRTGTRSFRLTSSPTNAKPSLGANTISFAEGTFQSGGTVQNRRTSTLTIRPQPQASPDIIIDRTISNNFTEVIDRTKTINTTIKRNVALKRVIDKTNTGNFNENIINDNLTPPSLDNSETLIDNRFVDRTVTIDNTVTNNITRVEKQVVQDFTEQPKSVKVAKENPLSQTFRSDENGAFLTSVDIYMATKSSSDNLVVQIRATELATPTDNVLQDYCEVVLSPDQINVSDDGSVATNVTFPSPVYLEPGLTYALVLMAQTTNDYSAWIARMGEASINGGSGGDVIISKQYINGSLFKSQNGSVWTPSEFEDLKFTLYKAAFVTDTPATVYLSNPDLGEQTHLIDNPVTTLPRKLKVPVNTGGYAFKAGDEIASVITAAPNTVDVRASIESLGGPLILGGNTSFEITDPGAGYINGVFNDVTLYPINSQGSGATFNVTVSGNEISSLNITRIGSGYKVGDTLGITTADMDDSGGDCIITIKTIGDTDTLYLTNTLGRSINDPDQIKLYNPATDTLTDVGAAANGVSEVISPLHEGDVFVLDLPSHGMHDDDNVLTINNVLPDTPGVPIQQRLNLTTNNVVVLDSSEFTSYEGITTAVGYGLIGGEIIEYTNNNDGTLGITSRGVDNTAISIHDPGSRLYRYELSGVSLRKINKTHDLPKNAPGNPLAGTRDLNSIPIKIDRIGRQDDGIPGNPQLNFNQQQQAGGKNAYASQNIQFSRFYPNIGLLSPGSSTSLSAEVRTVSGTSAGGAEESFVDQGYEACTLNDFNRLETTRIVCSKVNEEQNISGIPKKKSFTLALTMSTSDPNLSPVIDMNQLSVILSRSALNRPVTNFADDPRINQITGDPHASLYVSRKIELANPARAIKTYLTAYRDESADIRVLYRIFTPDTVGSTEPTWELFPGYTNLVDLDGDGVGDEIIDLSKNNGLSDQKVRGSAEGESLEYVYTMDNLPEFSAYQIKIIFAGTNEAKPPTVKNLRTIALA